MNLTSRTYKVDKEFHKADDGCFVVENGNLLKAYYLI